MPKRHTEIATPYGHFDEPASGLHDPIAARTHRFHDLRARSPRRRRFFVGRGPDCDIRVRDAHTSSRHLALTRQRDGSMRVEDLLSTNGLWVDGIAVSVCDCQRVAPALRCAPLPPGATLVLRIGMRIRIGHTYLYAVDADDRFPIHAVTLDDYIRHAAIVYGNNRVAAERIGTSRETIRRRLLGEQANA